MKGSKPVPSGWVMGINRLFTSARLHQAKGLLFSMRKVQRPTT
ncbi:hypothetical protein EV14_2097 [Prochlorococcus sp. MIT 0703]|nr:hypothetical protein EV12_3008 [Prochlorococcus sp. MIT 0701]KGG31973.1 hypothetical protein EV14_2097 [Prochlorococcus sp. MIT 0703]